MSLPRPQSGANQNANSYVTITRFDRKWNLCGRGSHFFDNKDIKVRFSTNSVAIEVWQLCSENG